MIQLIPQLRILLACQPVDLRNGIDGLASVCKRVLAEDPFSGALFVFRNRRGAALKLLCYDGVGFWLITRRISEGRLRWWPAGADAPLHPLTAQQLSVLLLPGENFPTPILRPRDLLATTPKNSTANRDVDSDAHPSRLLQVVEPARRP